MRGWWLRDNVTADTQHTAAVWERPQPVTGFQGQTLCGKIFFFFLYKQTAVQKVGVNTFYLMTQIFVLSKDSLDQSKATWKNVYNVTRDLYFK